MDIGPPGVIGWLERERAVHLAAIYSANREDKTTEMGLNTEMKRFSLSHLNIPTPLPI